MSTWLYLRCTTHTPPLVNDGESGQHLSDLPTIWNQLRDRATVIAEWAAHRENPEKMMSDPPFEHHYARNTAAFLTQHPDCDVDVVDEYGTTHPVPDFSVTIDNTPDPQARGFKPWTFGQVAQLPTRDRRVTVSAQPGDWLTAVGRVRITGVATEGRGGTPPHTWPTRVTLHLQAVQPGKVDQLRDLFTETDGQADAGWRCGAGNNLEVFHLWPQPLPAEAPIPTDTESLQQQLRYAHNDRDVYKDACDQAHTALRNAGDEITRLTTELTETREVAARADDLQARLDAARSIIEHPGNWSTYSALREHLRAAIDGHPQ